MADRILLRPTEFAEAIGASKSTAYALIAKGVVPSVRIGNLLRVPADSVRKLIQDQLAEKQ